MPRFSVDPVIARAHTLHSDFYTSAEVLAQCKETIFAPSWQFIGHSSMVAEPESVHPFTLLPGYLDEPLLLTRNKENSIYLLSNVCTHRGNLLAEKSCHISRLRCRYHGRSFGLDGKFRAMPGFEGVENFPSESDNLPQLPLFQWGQWLFTSLNAQQPPETYLGDMMKRVAWMPIHDFKYSPDLGREFEVRCNWALYCENYLEGFHIPFVHAGLNSVLDFESYTTELFFPYANLQIGLAKQNEDCFDLPPDSPDFGKKIAAYYFWVFPNLMFNFYPWGLSVNIVNPVGPDTCKVTFLSYVWNESKLGAGAGANLDRVELEDEEIVEQVQRGIRSRFYTQGRYSATMEKGPHHFHSLLADRLR